MLPKMASQMSLRSLVFALLLSVCLSQLFAEAIKIPGFTKKKMTKEEEEEAKRLKAAKLAYKDMFVHSKTKLTRDEIFERLESLMHYYGSEDHDMPIDFRMLMKYNQTDEANCDDRAYVEGLKRAVKQTRKDFKPLHEYVEDCFLRQLEVCNYENRFKQLVERFQRDEPEKWQLIEDFNGAASRHGPRMYDWKGKHIDNSWQMNEALKEMFDWKLESNQWTPHEASFKLYNVGQELIDSCKLFAERLGASLSMTTYNPKIKQNEEMLEWLRYSNICGQVERVNFDRAIGDMFGKYHWPEAQKMWEKYQGWRELWV